jgi:hypothetical protein
MDSSSYLPPFDPLSVPGISFFEENSGFDMRYIYPEAPHWCRGWILKKLKDGRWITHRKATDQDIKTINRAIVRDHHAGV